MGANMPFPQEDMNEIFKISLIDPERVSSRENSTLEFIAVRLRVKKKVQNLSAMWYKEFAKNFATQGDFGHESP